MCRFQEGLHISLPDYVGALHQLDLYLRYKSDIMIPIALFILPRNDLVLAEPYNA